MPIRPETRHLYPSDWPAVARAVKDRAFWRCQGCGAAHGAWGFTSRRGFHAVSQAEAAKAGHGQPPFRLRLSRGGFVRVIEVCLQAAHMDHEPSNCDPGNLRALCQRCHLAHDVRQHAANAAATRHARMKTPELF